VSLSHGKDQGRSEQCKGDEKHAEAYGNSFARDFHSVALVHCNPELDKWRRQGNYKTPSVPSDGEWYSVGRMTVEVISRAVNIFRELPESSDLRNLPQSSRAGVKPKHAARLVEFLPVAYCRLIFAGTGTRFADMFRRRLHDDALSPERTLASDAWTEVMRFAKTEQGQVTGSELVAVAAHSAEFDVLN
jgi:hypothetical protein